ncbi:MAG: putative toxin-antitoxin system toxin component, PIN family, partial [Pseudomonadota bacterium]
MIKACIDTNIWISGLIYKGAPAKVVDMAFERKFELILSSIILQELSHNLITKFAVDRKSVDKLFFRLAQVADIYEPQ